MVMKVFVFSYFQSDLNDSVSVQRRDVYRRVRGSGCFDRGSVPVQLGVGCYLCWSWIGLVLFSAQ